MKRVTKILTLILIVVFAVSVFAGCDLVGRNVSKYRNVEAIKVGNETISVGKLLDTFNSYYNNYYYYISAGYLDASQLLDMVMSSLVQQYMQIDDYVTRHDPLTDLTELQKSIHNAEYLTKDQFAYAVKYVNYLAYSAFDQYTNDNLTAKLELEAEETEDTSRDFTEYDELTDMNGNKTDSYAVYNRDQNFVNEEADEYFEENYPYVDVVDALNLDKYVYDLGNAEQKSIAEKRVKEYNDRRGDGVEEELTVDEYVEILADTKKQYEETIQNSYGYTLDEFLRSQLVDMVSSCIITNWNYEQYESLESDPDLENTLKNDYDVLFANQQADFKVNNNFDSFITGLGSSSLIYNIPENEADNYVFVKNILIPFTTDQTTILTNLQNQLGSNEKDAYIAKRNEFAAAIVAEYFKSDKYDSAIEAQFDTDNILTEKPGEEKGDKSTWFVKTNVFTNENGQLSINPDGILGKWLNDGTVTPIEGLDKTQTIVELMKRFNTDTAQHTAAFDYVVYVGEDWETYSHSWVKEFYTAVNQDLVPHDGSEGKEYTLCVSSYGVHIIYLSGKISDKVFAFDFSKHTDTSDPNYQLFKNYFDTQVSIKTQDALRALEKTKLSDSSYSEYIQINKGFDRFLKDNEFDFDFDEFIADLISEL